MAIKKYIFIFSLLILCIAKCFATAGCNIKNDSLINLNLLKTVAGNYKLVEVDNLGNVYLVTPNNQIKKLSTNLDSIAVFNNPALLGNITSIDVSNPFKILVFYKSFSTIVVLDKYLSVLNTIELQKKNLFTVSAVTTSYDNNIWLFDEANHKIKRIDSEGNVLVETIDFRLLFKYEKIFTADYLKDIEGKLYLYNKDFGFFVFDYYGGLQNKFALKNLTNVQFVNKQVIGFDNDKVIIYNIQNHLKKTNTLSLDSVAISKIKLYNNMFFVLCKDGLHVYQQVE